MKGISSSKVSRGTCQCLVILFLQLLRRIDKNDRKHESTYFALNTRSNENHKHI